MLIQGKFVLASFLLGTTPAGATDKGASRQDAKDRQLYGGASRKPTYRPTKRPTRRPTKKPTTSPTEWGGDEWGFPTMPPTDWNGDEWSDDGTASPTDSPTDKPTKKPTRKPTYRPTKRPTRHPTRKPTTSPTEWGGDEWGFPTMPPTDWNGDEWSGDGTNSPIDSPTDKPTEWKGSHDRSGVEWSGDGTDAPTESPTRNKCKQLERNTCCNQPDGWSYEKKKVICEELGCNLKKCDKRKIDSDSSSSDEHDPTEPPTLSPVEWSGDGFETRVGSGDEWNGDEWSGDGTNEPTKSPTREQFPPLINKFKAPEEDSVRSPCPAINTLANHGFINRDGKDINVLDLAAALEEVYNVRDETLIQGPITAAIELGLTDTADGQKCTVEQKEGGETCFLDLDNLFEAKGGRPDPDGAQEHDSSFIREDFDQESGVDDRLPSPRLIKLLFNSTTREILQPYEIMEYQRQRIQDSCERRQGSAAEVERKYTGEHRGGMAIQGSLLFVLAQIPVDETPFMKLNKGNLRSILEEEKLPNNFNPAANQRFTFLDNVPSDNFRDAFRQNVETAICAFCNESISECDRELARLPRSGEREETGN